MKADQIPPLPSFLVPDLSEPSSSPTAGTGGDGALSGVSGDNGQAPRRPTGRDLVPATRRPPPAPTDEGTAAETTGAEAEKPRTPLDYIAERADVRAISPRDLQALALDLYAVGAMTYDDYALLAFQPELHPDFSKTIGALTGEAADPDRPRDYLMKWEQRLRFEQRHNPGDHYRVKQASRIVGLLRRLSGTVDTSA